MTPPPVRYIGFKFRGRKLYIESRSSSAGIDAADIQALQKALAALREDPRLGYSSCGEDIVPIYDPSYSHERS